MHIQAARHLRQQNTVIAFFVVRQECLADDRTNRRIAVVGRDIEKPVLDRIQSPRWNPARGARVIDTEEHDAPFCVRKCNQLAGKLFRVGRRHGPVPEANFLELGSSVFSRPELVSDLLRSVEHQSALPVEWLGTRVGACNPCSGADPAGSHRERT